MILDVGCGINPKGDVNVDLPKGGDHGVSKTKADIIASVYHLPFRSESFDGVMFYGLLHHLADPNRGWREILRVSRGIVTGVEPNLNMIYPRDKTEPFHSFRKRQLLSAVKCETHIISIDRVLSFRKGPCVDFRLMAWRKGPA